MTDNTQTGEHQLKREVGLFGVVALGLGTAIGVSIFSIIAPTFALAGPAMLVSMACAAVPMIVFAWVYAFMGSAVPVTGASFEWPRRYISPFAGFFISWLRIAGSTAALIVLTMVLVSYLGSVVTLPMAPTMFVIFLLVFVVNMIGISAASLSQTLLLFGLIGACAVYSIAGVPAIEPANFQPFFSHGVVGVFAAVPLMISLFLGIESAVEVGGEIKKPQRTIPLGITLSVVLTCIIYFIVAAVTMGVLGNEGLANTEAPLLDGAKVSLGELGVWLIVITAFISIGSSINATFIILTRFLYAMGHAGMLPGYLGRIHGKSGVPRGAVITAFCLCCLGLFMPQNLIFLFLAVNIPTVLKYTAICLSSLRVITVTPELYERAHFKPSQGMIRIMAWLGIVMGLIIIVLGMTADWRPFAALIIWAVCGLAFYNFYVRPRARSDWETPISQNSTE